MSVCGRSDSTRGRAQTAAWAGGSKRAAPVISGGGERLVPVPGWGRWAPVSVRRREGVSSRRGQQAGVRVLKWNPRAQLPGECNSQAAGFVKSATPDDLQRGMMGEAAGAPASRIGIAALARQERMRADGAVAWHGGMGACRCSAMRGSVPRPNHRPAGRQDSRFGVVRPRYRPSCHAPSSQSSTATVRACSAWPWPGGMGSVCKHLRASHAGAWIGRRHERSAASPVAS